MFAGGNFRTVGLRMTVFDRRRSLSEYPHRQLPRPKPRTDTKSAELPAARGPAVVEFLQKSIFSYAFTVAHSHS